jgi:hypothetical protein
MFSRSQELVRYAHAHTVERRTESKCEREYARARCARPGALECEYVLSVYY